MNGFFEKTIIKSIGPQPSVSGFVAGARRADSPLGEWVATQRADIKALPGGLAQALRATTKAFLATAHTSRWKEPIQRLPGDLVDFFEERIVPGRVQSRSLKRSFVEKLDSGPK